MEPEFSHLKLAFVLGVNIKFMTTLSEQLNGFHHQCCTHTSVFETLKIFHLGAVKLLSAFPQVAALSPTVKKEFCSLSFYLFNVPFCPETPSTSIGFDDFSIRVEPLGEALVLTPLSCWAHLGVALILQHPVQTLGLQTTGVLIRWLAVTAGDF